MEFAPLDAKWKGMTPSLLPQCGQRVTHSSPLCIFKERFCFPEVKFVHG